MGISSRNLLPPLAALVAALSLGCDALSPESAEGQSYASKVPVFDHYDYKTPVDLARGEEVYLRHCAGCHGEKGDGNGPAAEWLDPKPRNFIDAKFKFSSTPSGKLPADEDLMHTLVHGAKGTSMPEWRLLPEPDRVSVIAYLKTFSPRWAEEEIASPVPVGRDPYQEDPIQGILDGEIVYHAVATCWSCHPAYADEETMRVLYEEDGRDAPSAFRDNLFHSLKTTSDDGDIYPPDFTWDKIKTGANLEQIFLRIATGITGTAMPTWAGILPDQDIWAMAHYVHYLATEHREFPRSPEKTAPFAERYPEGVYPILVPPAEGEEGGAEDMDDDAENAEEDA